jgi:hypothetical protein
MNALLEYVNRLPNFNAIRNLRTDVHFLNYLCTDTLQNFVSLVTLMDQSCVRLTESKN